MKRIRMNFQKFIRNVLRKAKEYGVNPKIFLTLYLFSFLPFYGGVYLMVKGAGITSVTFRNLIAFKVEKLQINNELIFWGFLVNQAGWTLPYLYVVMAGRRFKWYIRLALVLWAFLLLAWRVGRAFW